jgi:hypothetical protein
MGLGVVSATPGTLGWLATPQMAKGVGVGVAVKFLFFYFFVFWKK